MLRHHHVAHHHKPIALPCLFEPVQKQSPSSRSSGLSSKIRPAAITAHRDEMEIAGAIVSFESLRHSASVAPEENAPRLHVTREKSRPCKKRHSGALLNLSDSTKAG